MFLISSMFPWPDLHIENPGTLCFVSVFRLFLRSLKSRNGAALEHVVLPCLQMIHWLLIPSTVDVAEKKTEEVSVDIKQWLMGWDSFAEWRRRKPSRKEPEEKPTDKNLIHEYYLSEKYGLRWLRAVRNPRGGAEVRLDNGGWLERALFCPGSMHVRASAAAIFKQICKSSPDRKASILDALKL